jgi:hypothetical protein
MSSELACQWRIFLLSGKQLWKGVSCAFRTMSGRQKHTDDSDDDDSEKALKVVVDPALPSEQVEMWMWLPGLIVVLLLTCMIMKWQFNMPIGEVLLALFLAFFFSFLAIQSTGATGNYYILI